MPSTSTPNLPLASAMSSALSPSSVQAAQASIDIFCRVIDNYGDIGVCWRLACNLLQTIHQYPNLPLVQLLEKCATRDSAATLCLEQEQFSHTPHSRNAKQAVASPLHLIRLWVDDLRSFTRILPIVDAQQDIQTLGINQAAQVVSREMLQAMLEAVETPTNTYSTPTLSTDETDTETLRTNQESNTSEPLIGLIQIHAWQAPLKAITPAPISIEAFACELDAEYIAAMPGHTHYWFNLEYLSAEDWVTGFHAQASLQNNGVAKYFFFPGFNTQTGGLLREVDLLERQATFLVDPHAQAAWLRHYMSEDVSQAWQSGARLISFFSYPHATIESLFKALVSGPESYIICLPQGVVTQAESLLEHYLIPKSKIMLHRFEFVEQYQYDYLLSLSDINFVRGEDSFVRAIWAGKPLVWHIYPQEEQAHIDKLQAWLSSYPMPQDYRDLLLAWNAAGNASRNTQGNDDGKGTGNTARKGTSEEHKCAEVLSSFFQKAEVRQEFSAFALQYRDFLRQNPTLSFSLLSFQAKTL